MNKIIGYRSMLGLTQEDIAKMFNLSIQAYRNKEKGRTPFKQEEMRLFKEILVNNGIENVTIDDIFFDNKPSQNVTKFIGGQVNANFTSTDPNTI